MGDKEDEVQAKPKKEEDVHAKPARPRGRPPKASKAVQDAKQPEKDVSDNEAGTASTAGRMRMRMLDECADDVRTEH